MQFQRGSDYFNHPELDMDYRRTRFDLIRRFGFASQIVDGLRPEDGFGVAPSRIYTTGLADKYNLELVASSNVEHASQYAPAINLVAEHLNNTRSLENLDTFEDLALPFMVVQIPQGTKGYEYARGFMLSVDDYYGPERDIDLYQIITPDDKGHWPLEGRWDKSVELFFDKSQYFNDRGEPLVEGMRG